MLLVVAQRIRRLREAGLGLAIARDIATAHGATITIAEAQGGGTRAVITLAGTAAAPGEATRTGEKALGADF